MAFGDPDADRGGYSSGFGGPEGNPRGNSPIGPYGNPANTNVDSRWGVTNRVAFYMGQNPLSVGMTYDGPLGVGRANYSRDGLNYSVNPADIPGLSVTGRNFDTPSLSYNLPMRDPRIGASLNLHGNRGKVDPSLSVNYSGTPSFGQNYDFGLNIGPRDSSSLTGSYSYGNTGILGNIDNRGRYGVEARAQDLFGIQGLDAYGNFGDDGRGVGISYGGNL